MKQGEFYAGAKVRTRDGEGVVVGPSPIYDTIVVAHEKPVHGHIYVGYIPNSLTLIPETVTVTVEVPGDDVRYYTQIVTATDPENEALTGFGRTNIRVANALREAVNA